MFYIPKLELKTRKQLREIEVVKREERVGETWKGIQHGEFVDTVVRKLKDFEIEISAERYTTNPNGSILYGSIDLWPVSLDGPQVPTQLKDWFPTFTLAFSRSNDSRHALRFLHGIKLLPMDCGISFGVIQGKKKAVSTLEFDIEIESAINLLSRKSAEYQGTVNALLARDLKIEEVRNIIMIAVERDLHPWRTSQHVYNSYNNNPSDCLDRYNTAWSLLLAFTEVAKTLAIPYQYKTFQNIYQLIVDTLGMQNQIEEANRMK